MNFFSVKQNFPIQIILRYAFHEIGQTFKNEKSEVHFFVLSTSTEGSNI